jgi:hypothetical protein
VEQLQKAVLIATYSDRQQQTFEVQFNPTEFSLDKGAQIAEISIPGLDAPLLQFVRGQNERMTLDLFFDTTEHSMAGADVVTVTTLTDRIYELVKIEPAGHAPPVCTFVWGREFPGGQLSARAGNQRRTHFDCIIESVKQKFTLFSPEGIPLRATLTLTLREYKTLSTQLQQLGLNSPDRTHSHVIQQGETLPSIADRYYRKPGEWRPIAEQNGIADPRRLVVGTILTIPTLQ